MANIKSAKKRAKTNELCRSRNVARKTAIKTASKKVLIAIENQDVEAAKNLLRDAESKIARAKGKGVLKPNTAARKISKLAKKLATLTLSASK